MFVLIALEINQAALVEQLYIGYIEPSLLAIAPYVLSLAEKTKFSLNMLPSGLQNGDPNPALPSFISDDF